MPLLSSLDACRYAVNCLAASESVTKSKSELLVESYLMSFWRVAISRTRSIWLYNLVSSVWSAWAPLRDSLKTQLPTDTRRTTKVLTPWM